MCEHDEVAGLMDSETGEVIAVACLRCGQPLDVGEVIARVEGRLSTRRWFPRPRGTNRVEPRKGGRIVMVYAGALIAASVLIVSVFTYVVWPQDGARHGEAASRYQRGRGR